MLVLLLLLLLLLLFVKCQGEKCHGFEMASRNQDEENKLLFVRISFGSVCTFVYHKQFFYVIHNVPTATCTNHSKRSNHSDVTLYLCM